MRCLYPVILPVSVEDQRLKGPAGLEAQRRRAREALALSCAASNVPLGPLLKDERNAPRPFGQQTYWSISHKRRYVAAVVASTAVGIDIEEIVPREEGLYAYIADEAEWALAHDQGWATFFRYWTAKEAVLKAVGTGIAHVNRARIHAILADDRLQVSYDSRLWTVRQFRFQDHIVSLTHDDEVVWKLTET